ncbi:tRNA delta(2)-isopentenylpyrophosphate transferase [compost metagenome]
MEGELTLEELSELISINTGQLAKRQRTWFQRDKDIHWFSGDGGFNEADTLVEKFLKPLTI